MENNWQTKKLGEVCKVIKGKKPELYKKQAGNMLPYLGARFMRGTKDAEFALVDDKNSVAVSKKDLVIICDGSKSGDMFSGFEGVLSSTMGKMDFERNEIEPNYLKRFLDLNFDLFNGAKRGAAIPHLDFNIFKNLGIPLPSLSEQKEIVKVLDEKMGKISEAKRLRAGALADTEKILSKTLAEIFEKGRGKGWEEKNLGDVLEKIVGGGTPSKSNLSYWNGKIPWASVKDLKEGEFVLTRTRDFITESGLSNSSSNLIPSGTLITSTRMGLGRVAKTTIDTSINQDLKALFPKKNLNVDFLLWFLVEKAQEIISAGKGATVSGVRLEVLRQLKFLLPSLPEQKKIVAKLDALSSRIRELRELQTSQLADLKSLEHAYLREAFKGEL
jgi:type I restriction enzyme S subunit